LGYFEIIGLITNRCTVSFVTFFKQRLRIKIHIIIWYFFYRMDSQNILSSSQQGISTQDALQRQSLYNQQMGLEDEFIMVDSDLSIASQVTDTTATTIHEKTISNLQQKRAQIKKQQTAIDLTNELRTQFKVSSFFSYKEIFMTCKLTLEFSGPI